MEDDNILEEEKQEEDERKKTRETFEDTFTTEYVKTVKRRNPADGVDWWSPPEKTKAQQKRDEEWASMEWFIDPVYTEIID